MSSSRVNVGVACFIWKDGKFLMGQRKGAHGTGTWSVPGGWQEHGESWADAAKREVLEETGIVVDDIQFVSATDNYFEEEDVHSVTVWLNGTWVSGEPQILEPDKFVGQQWCNFQSLPAPLFEPCWKNLRAQRPDLFISRD